MELVVGAGLGLAFTVLYDTIKEGMTGKYTEFTPLLGALRSTLESIQPMALEQMGKLNTELDLPNDDIEVLTMELWKGKLLIHKLSKVRWWNLKKSRYTEQLLELDGYLKILLRKLKMQQARDIKLNLLAAQHTAQQLFDIQKLVQDLVKERTVLAEKARDFEGRFLSAMEENMKQVHGLQAVIEIMMKQNKPLEGVGFATDASPGAGLVEELKTLLKMFCNDLMILSKGKTPNKTVLGSMYGHTANLFRAMDTLNLRDDMMYLEHLRIDLQEGTKLLRKNSNRHTWNIFEKFAYTNKLNRLDACLEEHIDLYELLKESRMANQSQPGTTTKYDL